MMNSNYKKHFLDAMAQNGFTPAEEKDISYGVQLTLSDGENGWKVRLFENAAGEHTIDTAGKMPERLMRAIGDFIVKSSDPLLSPPLIGSDEAGKGDWIGPLTVCAIYADEDMYIRLAAAGVKDSKKLSGKRIEELKDTITEICPYYSVICLMPEAFNRLYAKYGNINTLLAAAHGEAIRSVYRKSGCAEALIDRFADESLMESELKGTGLSLHQQFRAEANFAVAAASILARYAYISRLNALSGKYGLTLVPGAGDAADAAASAFAAEYGKERLGEIVKLNYKNTLKVK
ncbi:MAG: ribonuclease HIII [Eubacteriaceae bacterium]|nr:ribonuclease HIII [Eubacteriaceae bacterium]